MSVTIPEDGKFTNKSNSSLEVLFTRAEIFERSRDVAAKAEYRFDAL